MTKDVLDFSQGVTRWAPIHRQALLYYIEAHFVTKDVLDYSNTIVPLIIN